MNRLIIRSLPLALILLGTLPLGAQELSLETCWQKAETHYPLVRQYGLIEKTRDYNLSNASKRYLPQVSLSAKASYQSEVTKLPLDLKSLGLPISIPEVHKDQYAATIDVSQLVWDGGATAATRSAIRSEAEVNHTSNEVSLYALKRRVSDLFFALLLVDEQMNYNDLYREELARTKGKVEAWLRGGVATSADLDAVEVDRLKAEQARAEYLAVRASYLEALSLLIGEPIAPETKLQLPALPSPQSGQGLRPELRLIDQQTKGLDAKRKQLSASLHPTLGLFAQGGYGRPGLNFLERDFSPYYIVGARLTWSLGSLYTHGNNKRLIATQAQSLDLQRETFVLGQQIDISRQSGALNKINEELRYDDEVIALRRRIYTTSEAKMEHGTLSGVDLMRDLTNVQLAEQAKILHRIQQLQTLYDLHWLRGE